MDSATLTMQIDKLTAGVESNADKISIGAQIKSWINPLSRGERTLREVADSLKPIGMEQEQVPFAIQLLENPKYESVTLGLFPGATTLQQHDYIHMVLGRGLLPKDEAFVIGFTMGSTGRMSRFKSHLFTSLSTILYPKTYQMTAEDKVVFYNAVKLGSQCGCVSLAEVNFEAYLDLPLRETRVRLGIDENLLKASYHFEKRMFPDSFESQRLL